MIYRNMNTKTSRGFTLLEALIAMVIISIGLLAVARFQSSLVSTSGANKARAEAIALAQAKIDDIRNYRDQPDLVASLRNFALDSTDTFATDVLAVADAETGDTLTVTEGATIAGVNADFTRSWDITGTTSTPTAEVDVTVSWADPKSGNTDSVTLSTNILFRDPEAAAALATDSSAAQGYPTSAGRAEYGDTKYGSIPGGAESNNDGTFTYYNASADRVELIDAEGYVRLYLDCSDYGCFEFVQISGLLWFDESDNDINIDNVFVKPTAGAVCIMNKDAVVDTGDFNYFPYTCYAGGAWFGNIIADHEIAQANKTASACIGDPISYTGNGIDSPKYSERRSYRGLLSQDIYTGQGTTDGDDLEIDDENSDGIGEYQTVGVRDELRLPNPNDENINNDYLLGYYIQADASKNRYLPGHNFVLLDLSDEDDDGCATALQDAEFTIVLEDASSNTKSVNAFTNTPDSFVCLNQSLSFDTDTSGNAIVDASGNTVTALEPYYDIFDFRIEYGYLDADRTQVTFNFTTDASGNYLYALDSTQAADSSGNPDDNNDIITQDSSYFMDLIGCGFDPSTVPIYTNTISGTIYSADAVPRIISGIVMNTSDDPYRGTPGVCTVTERASVGASDEIADYSCKFYHTSDGSSGDGFSGNMVIAPSDDYGCTPSYYEINDADTNLSSGYDFSCVYTGPDGANLVTTVALTSGDSTPSVGTTVTFTVTVTNNGDEDATNVSLTDVLDSGLTFVSAVPADGTYSSFTDTWTIGDLDNGDTTSMVVNAIVDVGTGYQTLYYTVTAPTADQTDPTNTGNDLSDSITVNDTTTADLITVVSLVSAESTVETGDTVVFAVTVTNRLGGAATVDPNALTIAYPSQLTLVSSDPGTDSNGDANDFIGSSWNIDVLDSGDSTTLLLTGTVNNGTQGSNPKITATAATSLIDFPSTDGDDLEEEITVAAANNADLKTTISVSDSTPTSGDTITYTVTIENLGPQDTASSSVAATLNLHNQNGLTFNVANTGGNGTYDNADGSWDGFDLNAGDTATLTLIVDVSPNAHTVSPITVTTTSATSNRTDPDLANDGALSAQIVVTAPVVTTFTAAVSGTIVNNDNKTITGVSIWPVNLDGSIDTGNPGNCPTYSKTAYDCSIDAASGIQMGHKWPAAP